MEGKHRLRFSLFEMVKYDSLRYSMRLTLSDDAYRQPVPHVIYIKSVLTNPFEGRGNPGVKVLSRLTPMPVYSHRFFPGMLESTFLSRSFSDQGVRLRVRKEPRILGCVLSSKINGQAS